MMLHIPVQFCRDGGQKEERLRRLLRDAAAAMEATEATLWVLSPDERFMQAALNHGPKRAIVEAQQVPALATDSDGRKGSVVGDVMVRGIGYTIGPDDEHNRTVDIATGVPTRSMAAVPVFAGRAEAPHMAAVLTAFNRRDDQLFDFRSLEELNWWAYLAGLVLNDYDAEKADAGEAAAATAP